jgi:7-cyano-7-deazaguanine synthase in queuosine biosynthesis
MNKTELIDKLLHLGSTIEICNSTQTSKKAKELAHTLLDEYLEAINYTHSCKSDSELLKCGDCDCKIKYENIGCDTLKDCKKEW